MGGRAAVVARGHVGSNRVPRVNKQKITLQFGEEPVQLEMEEAMYALGSTLDQALNDPRVVEGGKKWGFLLMCFEFSTPLPRVNYISNTHQSHVLRLLQEQVEVLESVLGTSEQAN